MAHVASMHVIGWYDLAGGQLVGLEVDLPHDCVAHGLTGYGEKNGADTRMCCSLAMVCVTAPTHDRYEIAVVERTESQRSFTVWSQYALWAEEFAESLEPFADTVEELLLLIYQPWMQPPPPSEMVAVAEPQASGAPLTAEDIVIRAAGPVYFR